MRNSAFYLFALLVTFGIGLGSAFGQNLDEATLAVEKNPESAEAWFRLGEVQRQGGSRFRSLESYKRALEIDPNYAEAYNSIGLFLQAPSDCGLSIANRSPELKRKAIKFHALAISIKHDYIEAYEALGRAYRFLGEYQSAFDSYQRAIDLGTTDAYTYLARADSISESGDSVRAVELYLETIRFTNILGDCYDCQNKSIGVVKNGRSVFYSANISLGKLLLELERFTEARDLYLELIGLGYKVADYHFGLGLAYLNLGDKESARKQHKQMLKIANKEKLDVLRDIDRKEAAKLLDAINKF